MATTSSRERAIPFQGSPSGMTTKPPPQGVVVHYWTPLEEEDKHEIITDSGVSVVLLGNSGQDDTTQAPPGADVPYQWVAAYLERRYFMLPSGITLRVRRPGDIQDADRGPRPGYHTVRGQRHYLDANSEARGRLNATKEANARVWWWLLTEDMTKGGATWNNGGHVAALYQDELYEVRSGSRRTSALKDFGIYAGYGRVIIYVEPTDVLKANTPRTTLILQGGHHIDYADVGAVFAERMPDELAAYMAGQVTSEQSNHREAIRKNLKVVEDAFAQARYRRSKQGELDHYEPEDGVTHGASPNPPSPPNPPRPRPEDIVSRIGSEYLRKTREEREERIRAKKSTEDQMPTILWDTTESAVPAGRAATYVRVNHTVTASTSFGFYRDTLDWALGEARTRVAGEVDEETLHSICEDEIRRWFEEALTQAVVVLRPLSHSAQWGPMVYETALSDEGLTAAVVSHRWHMMTAVKRGLAGRLGRERKAA